MDAISGVGSWIGKNASTVIPGAATGAGFLSNWLAARRQRQRDSFLQNLSQNPAAMAKYVAGFQKPLTAGLTQNVGNQVQAYLGERGLSGTPGISADVETQALAPFVQQSQQQAINEAMGALGLMPHEGAQSNLSGTLALLMKGLSPTPGAPAHAQPPPSNQDTGLTFPTTFPTDSSGPFDLNTLFGGGGFQPA